MFKIKEILYKFFNYTEIKSRRRQIIELGKVLKSSNADMNIADMTIKDYSVKTKQTR